MNDPRMDTVAIAKKQRHVYLLNKIRNGGKGLSARELDELKEYESAAAEQTQNSKPETQNSAITSQTAAADYCGVSARTMRNWEKEHSVKDSRGNYILATLDQLRINQTGDGGSSSIKKRLLVADAEHKELRSELVKIEIDSRTGKLIPIEEIDRQRVSRIIEVRRVLMSLVRKLPAKLQNLNVHRMQEVCRDEIYRCLDIFAGEKLEPSGDRIRELLEYYGNLTPAEKRVFKTILEKRKKKSATENTPDKNIRGQAEIKK